MHPKMDSSSTVELVVIFFLYKKKRVSNAKRLHLVGVSFSFYEANVLESDGKDQRMKETL